MMGPDKWYIGCACDRKFVEYTGTMLASLAANGDIPEAVILVAGFGLTDEDRDYLRGAAGRPDTYLRFVDVDTLLSRLMQGKPFSPWYPISVLGRLCIPQAAQNGRLITLDSDMVINGSLRPLFGLDLCGQYLAAVHDHPRTGDPTYFNSGMMVIDIEPFRAHDIARRCIDWLGEQQDLPGFPDQDALNMIVGHGWYKLGREWNWYYAGPDAGDRALSLEDYERATVAHFAGPKPWQHYFHQGRPLYERYRRQAEQNIAGRLLRRRHVDANFVFTAYEVLLGRVPLDDEVAVALRSDADAVLRQIGATREFLDRVVVPIACGRAAEGEWSEAGPGARQIAWVRERLPLTHETRNEVRKVESWPELQRLLVKDERLASELGLELALYALRTSDQHQTPIVISRIEEHHRYEEHHLKFVLNSGVATTLAPLRVGNGDAASASNQGDAS